MSGSKTIVKIIPYDQVSEEDAEGGVTELFNDIIKDQEGFGFELRDIKMSTITWFLVVVFIFGGRIHE